MSPDPGKYDDVCTLARVETAGSTVVLIVLDGKHGTGLSVQSVDRDIAKKLPALLRHIADDLEASRDRGRKRGRDAAVDRSRG